MIKYCWVILTSYKFKNDFNLKIRLAYSTNPVIYAVASLNINLQPVSADLFLSLSVSPNCIASVPCLNVILYMTLSNNAHIWKKYRLNLVSVPNISGKIATCFLGNTGAFGSGKRSSSAELTQLGWIWPLLTDHTQYSTSRVQVVGSQRGQCENILFVTALRSHSQKLEHCSQEAMSTFGPCFPLRFAFLSLLGNRQGFCYLPLLYKLNTI